MSIQSEIERLQTNVSGAYSAVGEKGGSLPAVQSSDGLAAAILSIPVAAAPGTPLDPVEVYKATRPADWLPMPMPQDNEMYLLFHIPDGVSSLLAFTVTCTGNYTVALGTVTDGAFVQQSAVSVASGAKYEAELSAEDFGNLTSAGMKQVMIKVSGTDILTWEPSAHSKKTAPANFFNWNIVEISCRLPSGTRVSAGSSTRDKALLGLCYFAWYGSSNITNMEEMFRYCYSLIAVLALDTSKADSMYAAFYYCYKILAIPALDVSNATSLSNAFAYCCSLTAVPDLNAAKADDIQYIFTGCYSLTALPDLNASKVRIMDAICSNCYSLLTARAVDTSRVITSKNLFNRCSKLAKAELVPTVAGWAGTDISFGSCSLDHNAIVALFNSLPTITSAKTLTLTGNPGVSELTDDEKAIATNKNWTLTL